MAYPGDVMKTFILAILLIPVLCFAEDPEITCDTSMTLYVPCPFDCENTKALDSAQAYLDTQDSLAYAKRDSANNMIHAKCKTYGGDIWPIDCWTRGRCEPGTMYGRGDCWQCRGIKTYGVNFWQYCPLKRKEFRCREKVWRVIW